MGHVNKVIPAGLNSNADTVVAGTWRGKEYMRSRPGCSPGAKRSLAQLEQQAKFATTIQFVQGIKHLLELGFSKYSVGKSGVSSAISFILKNAITGSYPYYQVDHSQVLVSRGSWMNAYDGRSAADSRETIRFTWTNNAGRPNAKENDRVLVAAYCPAFNCTVYKIGTVRSAGMEFLPMPGFSGKLVHTWISFISADQTDIASSIYLQELIII